MDSLLFFQTMSKENKIIESWQQNAGSWIGIIDNNGIDFRKLVTNKAIIDTTKRLPLTAYSGYWLRRRLAQQGIGSERNKSIRYRCDTGIG